MRKLIFCLLLLTLTAPAVHAEIQAKKNTAFEIMLPMIDKLTPQVFRSGENVVYSCYYQDGVAAWAALTVSGTLTEIGTTGIYVLPLSAVEMNHDRVLCKFTGANSADNATAIKTNNRDIDDAASLDSVVEGSNITFRQAMRYMLSSLVGRASGGGTGTIRFRDLGNTKDRITATVDSNGNRIAVTLDGN